MTNKGLEIRLPVWSRRARKNERQKLIPDFVYAEVGCFNTTGPLRSLLIPLIRLVSRSGWVTDGDEFWRPRSSVPIRILPTASIQINDTEPCLESCSPLPASWEPRTITLYLKPFLVYIPPWALLITTTTYAFNIEGVSPLHPDIVLKEIFPHDYWLDGTQIARCEQFATRGAEPERVFLLFSTLLDRVDSAAIFEYQA